MNFLLKCREHRIKYLNYKHLTFFKFMCENLTHFILHIFIRKIRCYQFVVFETDKLIKKIHLNVCIPIIFNLDY